MPHPPSPAGGPYRQGPRPCAAEEPAAAGRALESLAALIVAGALPCAVAVACGVDGALGWLAASLALSWALARRRGEWRPRDGRGSPTLEG